MARTQRHIRQPQGWRQAAFIAALLLSPLTVRAEAPNDIAVAEAWARPTPPGITVGVVYLTISDKGQADDRLLDVATPVAEKAELHVSEHQGTTDMMRPLGSVTVKAGSSLAFAPLDRHIMLIGLKAPLVQGQHFPLTLHFEKAGNITTDVTVERSQPMPLHDHAAEAMPPGMKM